MNYIDLHTHSEYSVDAEFPIEEMCASAIKQGLFAYAITDHCECNRWHSVEFYGKVPNGYNNTYDFQKDYEASVMAVTKAKEQFYGKLNLICGIEMGQPIQDLEVAEKIVSDKRLDFVIGSNHEMRGYDDFAFLDYSKFDDDGLQKLLKQYFDEIYEMCCWGKFDVLGHLTYTLRYIEGNAGRKVSLTPYKEVIAESFRELAKKGKGIEINTSGIRQKYGKPFPTLEYVKLFKELGGEVLSIGSDAHDPENVGANISDGAELAREAGFNYLCYFKERKPNFIKL